MSLQRIDETFKDPNTTFTTGATSELNVMPPIYTTKLRLVTMAFTIQAVEVSEFHNSPKTRLPRIGIRKSVDLDTSHPVGWLVSNLNVAELAPDAVLGIVSPFHPSDDDSIFTQLGELLYCDEDDYTEITEQEAFESLEKNWICGCHSV